jgi:hypothetical protein
MINGPRAGLYTAGGGWGGACASEAFTSRRAGWYDFVCFLPSRPSPPHSRPLIWKLLNGNGDSGRNWALIILLPLYFKFIFYINHGLFSLNIYIHWSWQAYVFTCNTKSNYSSILELPTFKSA